MFKTLKRQLKDISKYNQNKVYLLFIIFTIIASIYPLITIFIPKLIIEELLLENINFNTILILVTILGALIIVLGSIKDYISYYIKTIFGKLRMKQMSIFNRSLATSNYENIEEEDYNIKIRKGFKTISGDGWGYEGTFNKLFTSFALIGTIVLYLILLVNVNFLIIIGIIFSSTISFIISNKSSKIYYDKIDDMQKYENRMNYISSISTDFKSAKDIRSNNLINKILDLYNFNRNITLSILNKVLKKQFLLSIIELVVCFGVEVLCYYLLINSYLNNNIDLAEVTMYLFTIIALSQTFKQFLIQFSTIRAELRATKDYHEFLDTLNNNSIFKDKNKVDINKIEIKNLFFKYPNTDKYIYKDFNLELNKNDRLAVVGVNGAGKTTLVKLLTGLFTPTSGDILINGINHYEFDIHEYQKMFSVVFQDINLYALTLGENITFNDDTNIDDIIKLSGLVEKINSLPNGLNTNVLRNIHEDGEMFSGGEIAKIGIARALYQNAPVVILDEPTSSLDAINEQQLYENFSNISKDKISIFISHRLPSTKFCNKIILIDNQKIIESGTHEELMDLKGTYYNMFTTQGKYYKEVS